MTKKKLKVLMSWFDSKNGRKQNNSWKGNKIINQVLRLFLKASHEYSPIIKQVKVKLTIKINKFRKNKAGKKL